MEYIGEVVLEIPNHKICVNPWKLKKKHAEQFANQITEARIRHTAYGKVPPKEGELREAWLDRYAEYLSDKTKPKDGELASDFINRSFEPTGFKDTTAFMYDVLVACADLVGQGSRITPEIFEDLELGDIDNFIRPISKALHFPIPELLD